MGETSGTLGSVDGAAVAKAIDATLDVDSFNYTAPTDDESNAIFTSSTGADAALYYYSLMQEVPYGDEASTNQYEFVLRVRTATAGTETTPLYISEFNLVNTASTLPSLTALTYGDGTGISGAGAYSLDLFEALKMNVTTTGLSYDTSTKAYTAGTSSTTTYGLTAFASTSTNVAETRNAVGYYNAVTGHNIAAPKGYTEGTELKSSGSTALVIGTIPTTGYLEVRFVFYLDGWDSSCYDVCRQHGFTLSLSFSTASGDLKLYIALYN